MFLKAGVQMKAGYFGFNANVSFMFKAVKNLYGHPTYLCFGVK